MAKASDILGMNAREQLFRSLNSSRATRLANSKVATKRHLKKAGVPVPQLYVLFANANQVADFDFYSIKSSFVIKPSAGSAGRGILLIRKKLENTGHWLGVDGREYSLQDLELHINDILEGQYSTFGVQHKAFVEERISRHPKFKKYVYRGTPDIRVLIYNSVPVMAMLRLPTKESEGRANLHQGAIGVGIDIASGVTLKGVKNGQKIRYVPGTKRKLNGLKIPKWRQTLKTAVDAARAAGLNYCGVDLLLHKEKGPMVVELNASPGLSIQVANNAGLRRRLERVQGLQVRDAEHGVKVGQALFAEWFADKVKADEGLSVVNTYETVQVKSKDKKRIDVDAVVDTGAYRSLIDRKLAQQLGLLEQDNVLWGTPSKKSVKQVVEITYYLKGRRIKTATRVGNRTKHKRKLVIGRNDLPGFLINPQLQVNH